MVGSFEYTILYSGSYIKITRKALPARLKEKRVEQSASGSFIFPKLKLKVYK